MSDALLKAPSLDGVTILQREVYVSWQEKIPKDEIVHQVEPGEPAPTRRRTGVVLQFVWTVDHFPSGNSECKLQAVILDENVQQILMLPLKDLRVVPHVVQARCTPLPGQGPVGDPVRADRMESRAVVGRLVTEGGPDANKES